MLLSGRCSSPPRSYSNFFLSLYLSFSLSLFLSLFLYLALILFFLSFSLSLSRTYSFLSFSLHIFLSFFIPTLELSLQTWPTLDFHLLTHSRLLLSHSPVWTKMLLLRRINQRIPPIPLCNSISLFMSLYLLNFFFSYFYTSISLLLSLPLSLSLSLSFFLFHLSFSLSLSLSIHVSFTLSLFLHNSSSLPLSLCYVIKELMQFNGQWKKSQKLMTLKPRPDDKTS